MQAIVQHRYGAPDAVLQLSEIERPIAKGAEVLVRVHATTANGDDWHLMRGLPYVARLATGLFKPKSMVPGRDVSGTVAALGAQAQRFRVGDEVFGWCSGALAEYVSLPEDALAPKPANLTLDQAAAVPVSGFTALQGLRDVGGVRPGNEVLINGASGGVGTYAVQIAKALGANVTAVCGARNAQLARSLGADRVIDYAREDFTAVMGAYDIILDLIGNQPLRKCRRALRPKGTLVLIGGRGGPFFMGSDRFIKALLLSPFVPQRLRPLVHSDNQKDLLTLRELIEAGKVRPVIDRHYPFDRVPDAVNYLEQRHAAGKVIIDVARNGR